MFFKNLLDKIFRTGYFEPTGLLLVPVGTVCCKLTVVKSYIVLTIEQRRCT
jgi:hypothetical protein